jgi:hypothetical protein
MKEKSLSLCQRDGREVSAMHGGVSSGARRQRTKANLSPSGSCSSLAQFPRCSPLLRAKRVCLRFDFWHPDLQRRKKPTSLFTTLSGWLLRLVL